MPPGAALLDSPWGGVLLGAWGAVVAALLPLSGLVVFANLPLVGAQAALLGALGVTYALNTLAFVLAEVRHARRVGRERQAGSN